MQHFSKKFERVGASPKFPRSFPEVSPTFCNSADSRRSLLCGLFYLAAPLGLAGRSPRLNGHACAVAEAVPEEDVRPVGLVLTRDLS